MKSETITAVIGLILMLAMVSGLIFVAYSHVKAENSKVLPLEVVLEDTTSYAGPDDFPVLHPGHLGETE